ncbi:MAG TPA: LPS export ABC transporter periplasmic protein LptC [Salinimicrobium sp.]|nr:LPS export ABC transporter periplasmic protein LptC [Salinimicrobium sp.]
MKFTYRSKFSGIVTICFVAMLFSCEGNLKEVRELSMPADAPQAIGYGMDMVYTNEGEVVATLKGDKFLDFTNKEFPYREFPEGLKVQFFDDENQKSTVTADYGIQYLETGIVDLRGNVEIITSDSVRLSADQLYWDQKQEWVFTDKPNTITFKNGAVNTGQGFDANQEFTTFRSRSNIGVQIIEEEEEKS